ncbi:alcohol dehydrogenase family protein [Saccharopolyspora mangrovi]|uniref:Alcohol dehydrogenase family protein n=1 Tax=Saccharopolyspora mangrovi TaxID=3082379 RepID=A0ABU6AG40_9PSEU|nr:alcohol dehydrogenase family protein [Saccharopolyspora sp. S2-29]MEB3370538.1 alcohol dehydrogenase family protein [Saccharopolyspora sp. S2-29]
MRAVVLTGHGGLDKLVSTDELATPTPQAGEVLVRVGACGLNNTEVNTRTGWYDSVVESSVSEELGVHGRDDGAASSWNQASVHFPRIQGAAVVGRIAAVGHGADRARIGERVLVDPSVRDEDLPPRAQLVEYLGSERDGGFAEYVAVPSINAHVVDSPLSDAELATFPCSYDTAEEMLERAGLSKGETIAITGAAGGVGTALIQLALARGAHVIAIAGAAKESRLRELGAHDFVPRDSGVLREEVEELVGERGVDVVADVVGGAMFDTVLKMLRRGGRYTTAGAIGGPTTKIDLRDLIYKDLEMYGITNPTALTFTRLVEIVQTGLVTPLLEEAFPLSELRTAQERLLKRTHVGKYVIVP